MKKFLPVGLLMGILGLGLVVRLYKIDNPVADWHSWRQADTAAVTRNFVRLGVNMLYPRYDDFSDVSGHGLFNPEGYRFVEFPIFNLAHFSLYTLFSSFKTLEFWGRMTSVVAALTSAVFLYFIAKRHWGQVVGLLAAFFYLTLPFNIYFTRVILPDPLMVTLYLIALNFFDLKHKWLGAVVGSLAILVKPVAVFFLLPAFLAHFWVAALMLLPFGVWRLWSHLHPEGIPASTWLLNGDHIRFKGAFWQWIFGVRIGEMILGKWGIWPLMTGLMAANRYLVVWVIGALAYLLTFATGNVRHDYYQIPIIPVIALLLAVGVAKLWQHNLLIKGLVVMSVLFMLAFAWYNIRGNFQVNNGAMIRAAEAVKRLTPQDALLIATYNGDTAFLYNTDRRGFTHLPLPIKDLKDRYGIMYYVSTTRDTDTAAIMDQYTTIEQTPEYVLIKLDEQPDYWQRRRAREQQQPTATPQP